MPLASHLLRNRTPSTSTRSNFLDVQNYQCSAAVDLSLNLVQILRSQFSAESHSRLEPFNLQGHDWRLPTLPLINAKRVPFPSY